MARFGSASSRLCRGAWAAPPMGRDFPGHFRLWSSPLEPSALQALAWLGHQAGARHPLSCLAEPQSCRIYKDAFHEQSPITPTPFLMPTHPSTPAEVQVPRRPQPPQVNGRQ